MRMVTDANQVDEVDRKILDLLQEDPRIPNKQIAQITQLSETTIGNRLERMSSQNIARVIGQSDFKTRGWHAIAMLDVGLRQGARVEEVIGRLNRLENVITIYEMVGPPELYLKIAARNLDELSRLAMVTIGTDPDVERVDVGLSLGFGHVRAGFGNLDAPHQTPVADGADLQLRILAMLADNGRVSNREMARELGVAEVTVRNRTKALVEGRLLRYLLVRNPAKAGFAALAFVRFALRPCDLEPAVRQLAAMPNVFGTTVQTGPMNLLVSIYGRDWADTHALFSEMCARLPLLEKPTLRPAKAFSRHRYELAFVN